MYRNRQEKDRDSEREVVNINNQSILKLYS